MIGGYKDGDILRDIWDNKDPILLSSFKQFSQDKGTLCHELINKDISGMTFREKGQHEKNKKLAKKYLKYIAWSRGASPTKEALGSFYMYDQQKRLRDTRRTRLYIIVKGFTEGIAKQTIEGISETNGHKIRNLLKSTFSITDKGELDKLIGRLKSGDAKGDGMNFCLPRNLGGNLKSYMSNLEKLRQQVYEKTPEKERDGAEYLKSESIFDTLWAALPSTYSNFKEVYEFKHEGKKDYTTLRQAINQQEKQLEVVLKREARYSNNEPNKIRKVNPVDAGQDQLIRYIERLGSSANNLEKVRACWDCGEPGHMMGDSECKNPGGRTNIPERLAGKKAKPKKTQRKKGQCWKGNLCRNPECGFRHPPGTDIGQNVKDFEASQKEKGGASEGQAETLSAATARIRAFLANNGFETEGLKVSIRALTVVRIGNMAVKDDPETIHLDTCAGVTVSGDLSKFLTLYDTPDTTKGMAVAGVVGDDTLTVSKAGVMLCAAYDTDGNVRVIADPRAYYCPGFKGCCVNSKQLAIYGWKIAYNDDAEAELIEKGGPARLRCKHDQGQLVLRCLSRSATECAEYLHAKTRESLEQVAAKYAENDSYHPGVQCVPRNWPNWNPKSIKSLSKKLYVAERNESTNTVNVKAFVYSKLTNDAKARLCHRRLGYTSLARLAAQTRSGRGFGMDVYTELNKEDRLVATLAQPKAKPHRKKMHSGTSGNSENIPKPHSSRVRSSSPDMPKSKVIAGVEYQPLEFWDVDGVGPEHIKAYFPASIYDEYQRLNTHRAVGAYVFSDRVSKHVIVKLYKKKSLFYRILEEVILQVRAMGIRVRAVRSDCAGELMTAALTKAMESEYDFTFQHSKPLDPASGGNHEKAVGDIVRISRAQMVGAPHLPPGLWGVSMIHAAKVHQVLAHSTNHGYSPYEIVTGRPPDIKNLNLHVFGTPTLFGLTKRQRLDLALRGKHVTMADIGYFVGTQGASVLVYKPRNRAVALVTPNRCFYLEATYASTPLGEAVYVDHASDNSVDPISISPLAKSLHVATALQAEGYTMGSEECESDDDDEQGEKPTAETPSDTYDALLDGGLAMKEFCMDIAGETSLGIDYPENDVDNFRIATIHKEKRQKGVRSVQCPQTRRPTPYHVPIKLVAPFIIVAMAVANTLTVGTGGNDPRRDWPQPKNFFEALTMDDWDEWLIASRKEYESFRTKGVFVDTKAHDRDPKAPTIPLMEIYTRKWNPDGSLQKYKCRLVAWGQLLTEGVHYGITFAPTVSADTVRMFLAIGAQSGEVAWALDVRTAYLHAEQTKTLYAYRPTFVPFLHMPRKDVDGWRETLKRANKADLRAMGQPNRRNPGTVWELKKSVYGIPDAGAKWNQMLNNFFVSPITKAPDGHETGGLGLLRCATDPCLYYKRDGDEWLLVMAWVDDVPFNGTKNMKQWFKSRMERKFSIDFMGDMTAFLGMSVTWDTKEHTVEVTQTGMIEALCDTYRCYLNGRRKRKVYTPMPTGLQLTPATETEVEEAKFYPFPQLVGALSYLAQWTKVEIQVSVSMLSQHLKGWSKTHWGLALGVLEYLESTKLFGIIYSKDKDEHGANIIYSYGDADLGADKSRRSRTGALVMANGGVIFCKTKLQNQVQLSTAGAELTAQVEVGKAAMGLRNILSEIGLEQKDPTIIYQDNQAAIAISTTPGSINSKSKYLDLKLFKMREWISDETFKLVYCKTKRMLADILSKNLEKGQFCYCRDGITGYSLVKQRQVE